MIKKDKNYLQNLSDYIKKNVKKGYTKESLRWALVNQGHSRIEVEKAMRLADAELAAAAPILRAKPEVHVEFTPPVEEKKSFWGRLFG
jgi:dUTPase